MVFRYKILSFGKINPVMLKRISVYLVLFLLAIKTNAGPLDLWGIDITKSRAEITWCKNRATGRQQNIQSVEKFVQRDIPSQTTGHYLSTLVFYGDETACFFKKQLKLSVQNLEIRWTCIPIMKTIHTV
jgi:hypothetical protein